MKLLFLDVDGVLNDETFEKQYLANFSYYYENNILPVDPKKIEILSYLCNKYNLKVVLSSSWKLGYDEYDISNSLYQLSTILFEAGIDLIGLTPNIPNEQKAHGQEMWKEWDIECYLYEHPEVKLFCILDDENYDLESLTDYLVQTNYHKGNNESGGLNLEHEYQIRRALRNSNDYKR